MATDPHRPRVSPPAGESHPDSPSRERPGRRHTLVALTVWSALLAGQWIWYLQVEKEHAAEMVATFAGASHDRDISYRHLEVSLGYALLWGAGCLAIVDIGRRLGRRVAERNRAEQILRASEERLRAIIETSPDAIALADFDGRILMANRRAAALAGVDDVEDLIFGGKTVFDLLPPEEHQRAAANIRRLSEAGVLEDIEYSCVRRDASRVPVAVSGSLLRDPSGDPNAIVMIARDIADRKRTEEALHREKVFTDAVLDNLPGVLYLYDDRGCLVRWNRKLEEITGYSPEELSGMHFLDWFKGDDSETASIQEKVQQTLSEGRAEVESYLATKAGIRIPFYYTAGRLEIGGRVFFTGVGIDLTQRHLAEAARARSEELYRSLIENIDVGITLINHAHEIVTVNPAQARMFGKSVETFPGKNCFREFEKRSAPCTHCPGVRAMATRRPSEAEAEGVRDDGTTFAARLKAFPMLAPDGDVTGFIELVEDVTEYKRARDLLEHAKEEAEAASRAKSEFLANMSHESRTPLTAILGYADVMLQDPDSPEARDAADTIKRNGEHLLQIISDILDLSKIEAARLEPDCRYCSPRQIVNDVASLMRGRAEAKGLVLLTEYGGIPGWIWTDPLRLQQILTNLVGNAIKFTDAGNVRIVTQLVCDGNSEARLRFDVIDTGIGLEERQIGMLFQPFVQVDTSARRRFGGSGLGLAISRKLARLLGGDITVASSPGTGSTFSLSIAAGPLAAAAKSDGLPAGPSPTASTVAEVKLDCRVLLAEDGPDNQRLISYVLRKAGAEVTVVDNGKAAGDAAMAARREGTGFGLILMDIQMPVMDGYEAVARLRQEGIDAPILALTAHAMPEDREKCLSAGCDGYLSKPIAPKELTQELSRFLNRNASGASDDDGAGDQSAASHSATFSS